VAAAAKHESNPDFFVGQVLARSSPILTWRPALAKKAADEAAAEEISAHSFVDDRESSVHRISRAPTRRMVAWPVIPQVRRDHRESAWTIARRAAIATIAVAALVAIGIAAFAWEGRGVARTAPPVARVIAAHVIDEGFDTLVPPATPALAPASAVVASQVAAVLAAAKGAAPALSVTARVATQRGRAHHGHRHGASAAR
jgi:hypothetical protein